MPTFLRFPKTWLGVNKPLWTRKERICKRNWKFVISHPKRLLEVSNLKKKKRAVCLNFNPVDEFRWIFEYILWCWYHDSLRRDWVIKSNDDSLGKNAKLIPRSIYVYIYIYWKPQTAKTPSRILRLFQPEKGRLRHAWPHVQPSVRADRLHLYAESISMEHVSIPILERNTLRH